MVPESESFIFGYRAIQLHNKINVYHGKRLIELKRTFDFDRETSEPSACDMLISALLCDLAETLNRVCRNQNVFVEDFEATAKVKLVNPLNIVGVNGYEQEKPYIEKIEVDLYCYIETDRIMDVFEMVEQNSALVQLCNYKNNKIKLNWKPQK